MVSAGTAVGFVLALCLVGLREMRDSALRNVKDLNAVSQLPILGSIPLFTGPGLLSQRRRAAWLAWSASSLAGLGVMAAAVAHYYIVKL
jgi:hypothetical protein